MICLFCGDEEGNLACYEAGVHLHSFVIFSQEKLVGNERTVYRKENLFMVSLYQKTAVYANI